MLAKFSLDSPRYQSRRLQLRSPSLGRMRRTFAEGDAARMRDIGKGWHDLGEFRWNVRTPPSGGPVNSRR
jgi:hypothetical protein